MASQLNFRELQELSAEILGIDPDQVQMDKSFQRDLAADSLDLVELIMELEDRVPEELQPLVRVAAVGSPARVREHRSRPLRREVRDQLGECLTGAT